MSFRRHGPGSKRKFARARKPAPAAALDETEVKAIVKKAIQAAPEPKNYYESQIKLTVGYSGNIFNLFSPAQGDTSQQHDGDRSVMTHLDIRGRIIASTATDSYNAIRMILFYWNVDTAERVPAVNKILQATYAADSWTPYGPLVVGQERTDFHVLSDRTYDISVQANPSQSFHISKKLNKRVYFNAGATTGKGQLYALFISDDGVSVYPSVEWVSNVQFKDL